MGILLLKLLITPFLLTGTTLATRRWGPSVGGWLVGLPLTSGPVSFFLAVEQGRAFAATAAHGAINGLGPVIIFCMVYEKCASRLSWPLATASALGGYFTGVVLFSHLHLSFWASLGLVCGMISFAILCAKPVKHAATRLAAPRWDLPLRMVAATGIVLAVTAVSATLGPNLSGIISVFPVFTCVMFAFSHGLYGAEATRAFEHGVVIGSYAFAAFFVIVAFTVQIWPLWAVYLAACVGAMTINALVYACMARFTRHWRTITP